MAKTAKGDEGQAGLSMEPIGTLQAWGANPRDNSKAVDKVAQSIRRFGFASPIVANRRDGQIIAGHTRFAAAQKLGLAQVPVRWLDLSPEDAHALALADNRLGEIATWDDDKLRDVLRELRDNDKALLADTGFTDAELAGLLGEASRDLSRPDDDVKNDQQWTIMLSFKTEGDLQTAFAVAKGHGWACKIIE